MLLKFFYHFLVRSGCVKIAPSMCCGQMKWGHIVLAEVTYERIMGVVGCRVLCVFKRNPYLFIVGTAFANATMAAVSIGKH